MTQIPVSRLIAENRRRKWLSQAEAARLAGLHRSQWAAYECAVKIPQAEHVLAAIADVLGLDVARLRKACDAALAERTAKREQVVRKRLIAAYNDRKRGRS